MVSCVSLAVCILLSVATIVQPAHICNNGIHYFVEHSMKCHPSHASHGGFLSRKKNKNERYNEMLGCNLFDFAQGKRFNRFPDQQVHWPGGVPDLENFLYTQHKNVPGHSTCLMYSNCRENGTTRVRDAAGNLKEAACYGTTHEEFHMPDYCSRAIMSELSTVYNGLDRTTSLIAGSKVLFASADKRCGLMRFFYDKIFSRNSSIDSVLKKGPVAKACWNHADDWRQMYCTKYDQCKCPETMSPEECSQQADKVNCCKNKYQEFLNSKYNTYKGYPLNKYCQTTKSCAYNPVDEAQKNFDQGAIKDFANLY